MEPVLVNSPIAGLFPASVPSELLISYALNKAAQPMFMMSLDCRITWCNDAYAEARNLPIEKILGKRPPFLEVNSDNAIEVAGIWKSISSSSNWTTEFDLMNEKTGEFHSYQTVFTTISDQESGSSAYFVMQSDITEHKHKYQHLWKMANYDRLTGLANRGLFSSILDHSIAKANRDRQEIHVLFLDLDGFKAVNDNFGHDAGDFVLIEVGQRVQSVIRESDFVARLGGDEFAIILVGTQATKQAMVVANKIIDIINKPIVYQNRSILRVGVSVGLSTYPIDGINEQELKLKADAAMYEAKKSGKNRVCISRHDTPIGQGVLEFALAAS